MPLDVVFFTTVKSSASFAQNEIRTKALW